MTNKKCRLKERINWQNLKLIACWVFAFGLLAHGYCYFNANFSHDSLYSVYEQSPELMISVGRYLRPVYRLLRGNFTLPVINGFLSLCYLSVSVYLLTDILDIRQKRLVILTCGILTANTTIALMNATYLHDADAYGFALLLALAGVWVSLRLRHGVCYAVLFYFASLGIYQAYIDVAIYLILILALANLIKGEPVKKVYLRTFRYLLSIGAGIALYYLGVLAALRFTHLSGERFHNLFSSGGFSLYFLVQRLGSCVRALCLWFFNSVSHNSTVVIGANVLMLALAALLTLYTIRRRHLPAASVWGIIGILAMIPLGMNAITLLSNEYHWLTVFACYLSYLWVPALLQFCSETAPKPKIPHLGQRVWSILAAVLILDSCLFSNQVYLKKELENAATLSTFTRIVDRMEQTEGYVPGQTEVAFVGLLYNSPLSKERDGFVYAATGLWHNYNTTYYETYQVYLSYYLGYPADCVDSNEIQKYEKMEQVIAMPSFPAAGSVQMVGDVLVIKLSDVPREDAPSE